MNLQALSLSNTGKQKPSISTPTYLRIEPLWLHLSSHQKVVKVHDAVDAIVGHTKDNTHWLFPDETEPTEEEHSDMMVPMKEHEWFLVYHDEKGIQKFTKFAEDKAENPMDIAPHPKHTQGIIRDGILKAVIVQVVR